MYFLCLNDMRSATNLIPQQDKIKLQVSERRRRKLTASGSDFRVKVS
jgi:hypothetical protein